MAVPNRLAPASASAPASAPSPPTSTSCLISPSLQCCDPSAWEQRSTQILTVIRCFVDGLRSAPSLKEWLPPSINRPTTTKKEKQPGSSTDGSLLMHLNSLGIIERVQELQQQPREPFNATDFKESRTPEMSLGALLQNHHESDERRRVLYRIVFPLLENLEQCYEVLDNLPPTEGSSQSTTEETSPKSQFQSKTSGDRKRNTAPPPPGMLSLNDYTNVACLLEFAVSASLVPCLEYPQIYFPPSKTQSTQNGQNATSDLQLHTINKRTSFAAQRRTQALPKSLAGRISKMALTWGTMCAAKNHDSLCENVLAFSSHPIHAHDETSTSKDAHTLSHFFHIHNVFQAYNEMNTLAIAIGRILLLDRFRPMLLPRHLSDIYLTLFFAERLRWYLSRFDKYVALGIDDKLVTALIESEKAVEGRNSQRIQSLQNSLLLSPLKFQSSLVAAVATSPPSRKPVDFRDAALAYRSLLGGGASMIIAGASNPVIPPWLRLRLGQCLTKLAEEDLQSVVEVFVADARGPVSRGGNIKENASDGVMTGAAARLARALCAKPTSTPNLSSTKNHHSVFQEKMCSQFVAFLVVEGEGLAKELIANSSMDLATPRSSMAMHLTLWATISQLPVDNLHSYFITKLASGLIPQRSQSTRLTATQSIAAIAAWLLTVPSSLDLSTKKKVQSFLLSGISLPSLKCNQLTMLGQTLRFASSFMHKNATTSSLVVEIDKNDEGSRHVFVSLIEMTLAHMIHTLVRCTSETRLSSVALELLQATSANTLDKEGYRFERLESDDEDRLGKVYKRSHGSVSSVNQLHLIRGIECRANYLVGSIVCLTNDASEANESSDIPIHLLPSILFRLLLSLHYSHVNPVEAECAGRKNTMSESEADIEPLGCDGLSTSKRHELQLTATILLSALCENCSPSSLLGSQGEKGPDTGVLHMLGLVISSAAVHIEEAKPRNEESEELFSTASIVLSLLVAVLELGAQKRSDSDESIFRSILPSLRTLSHACIEREEFTTIPELAEMASHAMALIVARDVTENTDHAPKPAVSINVSRLEATIEKISQAECDLQSSQPPLRAKGVVSLRHIARSLILTDSNSPREEQQEVLIRDADTLSVKEENVLISRTLARVCLNALEDPESYVYLASIQTLVAISDVCPSQILRLMGVVVAKGKLNIDVAMEKSMPTPTELSLSPEQRIKATEALILMIRRRGEGISMHGIFLLDNMLFCSRDTENLESKLSNERDAAHLIQSHTHTYFRGGTNGEPEESIHSHSDEKKIRFNTGGPVFSMEENDVLHAGAISVVCELVSLLDPAIVSNFCYILVGLATDALRLEASRPVRRAAASLARELYDCTMREVTAEDGATNECACKMAVAIVAAQEEKMYAALVCCVSGDEITVNTKTRLVDPATQSRSSEAIELRLELKAMGILQAAAAIANSLEHESDDPAARAVRRALSRSIV